PRVPLLDRTQHLLGPDHDNVAAQHKVRAGGCNTDRVNIVGSIGDADIAKDGPALLREARHVDDANAFAFKMRRHAEDRAAGYDPGATDAGENDAVRMIDQRDVRLGKARPIA